MNIDALYVILIIVSTFLLGAFFGAVWAAPAKDWATTPFPLPPKFPEMPPPPPPPPPATRLFRPGILVEINDSRETTGRVV